MKCNKNHVSRVNMGKIADFVSGCNCYNKSHIYTGLRLFILVDCFTVLKG